ncbi:Scn11a [Symbiodinium pilosum]|uniref:Scn11a protein n=1 Tax=Symbiodinium pilosum TaxID=2952 RepID=A0A812QS60_SYMPI|nr:Scn11a [Symbiodinium pilosum]
MTFFLMAKGRTSLTDWMVLVDLFVIACGYVEMLLQYLYEDLPLQTISLFRALRLVRILRLTRLLRRTRGFRELQKLVRMMATCIKALFWSFVFCFMVMTVWALLIVEIINPLMQDLDLGDCEGCVKATSSVMHANLLLFKTVIAGDSWGDIAVPVIYAHPFSAIIFMGSLLTLIFGVLNLIVAVVVDTFAEARQRDVLNLAEEMEFNLAADQKFLERIFQRIDADGSGQVTFDELLEGARRDPEFQSRLRVMDIDESDLQQLFEMIDVHGFRVYHSADPMGA